MASATYEPIATTTLGSAAASITFSSIAATWTDLRLVFFVANSTGSHILKVTLNGDTGPNYSQTLLEGNGTSVISSRYVGADRFEVTAYSSNIPQTPIWSLVTYDVMSYAENKYKTVLATFSADQNGSGAVHRSVGLWRNTAAVTSLTMAVSNPATQLFATGSTATLYGIKAA